MNSFTEIVIRVVGSWNTKIFTPAWISEALLDINVKDVNINDKEGLEVVFNKELQPSFLFKGVRIVPTEPYVDIIIFSGGQDLTEEVKALGSDIVLNLLAALPFTPKLGVGFNYRIQLQYEDGTKPVNPEPPFPGFEVTSINVRKEEADFQLNIIISSGDDHSVLFNFHILKLESINSKTVDSHLTYINNLWKTRN